MDSMGLTYKGLVLVDIVAIAVFLDMAFSLSAIRKVLERKSDPFE